MIATEMKDDIAHDVISAFVLGRRKAAELARNVVVVLSPPFWLSSASGK